MVEGTGRIRVVVVDDSALMRAMLKGAIEKEGDLVVVATAADVAQAREVIRATDPDVITLDVEMPGMNGLDFLEKIMALRPTPVIMVSSLTARGTETSLEALAIGAIDAIAKPDGPAAIRAWGMALRGMVRTAAGARVQRRTGPRHPTAPTPPTPRAATATRPAQIGRQVIAIGASTGGVGAIGTLFHGLPRGLPPVLITQHMPATYTARFAARLAGESGQDVAEARDGERLAAGMVRIAPGDQHLTLARDGAGLVTRVGGTDLVSGHCPSVDRLFHSVAEAAAEAALGVILTGMGRDGAEGLLAMRARGARTLGQSAETCVVYGMPKVAMALGAVAEEVPLSALAERIAAHGRTGTARRFG